MPTVIRDGRLVAICISCGRELGAGEDAIKIDRDGALQCGICAVQEKPPLIEHELDLRYLYGNR